MTELKSFDAQEEEKGFFSFLKKPVDKITSMKTKYDKVETNVEKICTALEDHQTQLMKDVAMLDRMYEQNLLYFKELSMYILAGKKKLEEVKTTELTQLMAKAQASGQPEDAQAVKDLTGLCDRFEKKIHDLELTRMISIQTAPQIRLVQNSDTMMVERDPDYGSEYDSAVEESDGTGSWRGACLSGSTGAASGYGYDQRFAQKECGSAESGICGSSERV